MSLEECRRLADERLERIRESRRSIGRVDGEEVEVSLSKSLSGVRRERWVVVVFAYGMTSLKYFKEKEKDSAERYFEDLTQKYALKEEEK